MNRLYWKSDNEEILITKPIGDVDTMEMFMGEFVRPMCMAMGFSEVAFEGWIQEEAGFDI